MSGEVESISLSGLQSDIKSTLSERFSEPIWVHAELHEVNIQRNEHCYLQLIEKKDGKVVASVRATIWNFTFRMLKPYFESSTGYAFESGIKVALKVSVEYHEIYGFSLNVRDINPAYTIGEAALERRRILAQLEADGVLEMNAQLPMPRVLQRIAVISSSTAAGWGDWLNHITQNAHQYHFEYQLFEAHMQGDKTSSSIIAALDQIYQNEQDFDAVVLIRGGGSKLDLAAFDQYELALNLAQFPLPILTGIGHERDESVADLVAHTAFKTPTAVANFLIDRMQQFELEMIRFGTQIAQNFKMVLSEYQELLQDSVSDLQFYTVRQTQLQQHDLEKKFIQLKFLAQNKPQQAQNELNKLGHFIKISIPNRLVKQSESLNRAHSKIRQQSKQLIHSHEKSMLQFEQLIKAYHHQRILNKGYAIVRQDGSILHSVNDFKPESQLQIQVRDGYIDIKI